MATLDVDDIHALEQLRLRLQQLYNSLNSLQNNIGQSDPLPPWSSLQSQFSIISNNLQSIAKQLSQYQDLYASTVAHPLPTFPGRTQEAILQQLMRTRLEPSVEDWVERGQSVLQDVLNSDAQGKPSVDLRDLWEWAPGTANTEARKQLWGADYTLAEVESGVENVVTGLKRKLAVPELDSGDDDEEEDEDEEDEEENGQEDVEMNGMADKSEDGAELSKTATGITPRAPSMALDHVFRFMMTGASPPHGLGLPSG